MSRFTHPQTSCNVEAGSLAGDATPEGGPETDVGPGHLAHLDPVSLPLPTGGGPPAAPVGSAVSDGIPGPKDTCDHDGLILASRLREARTAIGLTQEDVATAVKLNRSAVSDIENGKRRVYGHELCRLSRLYRRPLAWLLGDEDDPDVSEEVLAGINGLTEHDQRAVLAFSRFLAHQSVTR